MINLVSIYNTKMLSHLFNTPAFLTLQNPCINCLDQTSRGMALCHLCRCNLTLINNPCKQCGQPVPFNLGLMNLCGSCLVNPPGYDFTLTPLSYQPPITNLITQLKFQRKLGYAKTLAQLLLPYLYTHYQTRQLPQLIIPVPLHRTRIQQRGFNQALQIAKYLGKALSIPIDCRTIIRHKSTLEQSKLPAKQRTTNVRSAFSCINTMIATHVAIIDDVMTTGQTVNAISQLLKRSGVITVDVWAIARAQLTTL